MYDKYMRECWTTGRIAEELTCRKARRAEGGTHWDSSQVRKVLVTPFHAGLVMHKDGSTTRGVHYEQRFWDPEDHERIVRRLKRNRKVGSRAVASCEWLLSGIIRCEHCGLRLSGTKPNAGRRQHQCQRIPHADGSRCKGVYKLAEPVEAIVVEQIRGMASGLEMQALALEQAQSILERQEGELCEELAKLEHELSKTQCVIDGLIRMRAAEEIDNQTFARQKAEIDAEHAGLEAQAQQVRSRLEHRQSRQLEIDRVREALADFEAVWQQLNPQQQRELLSSVLEELTLGRAEDDTGDVILRLKIHFLPAREYRLSNFTRRPRGDGIEGLSPRELAYLKHRLDYNTDQQIAELFQTSLQNARGLAKGITRRMGMEDLDRIAELARPRINILTPGLPLYGRVHGPSNRNKWTWTQHRLRILAMLARGMRRSHIAAELGIERTTVDNHVSEMMGQVGADSWQELVKTAIETRLIPDQRDGTRTGSPVPPEKARYAPASALAESRRPASGARMAGLCPPARIATDVIHRREEAHSLSSLPYAAPPSPTHFDAA